MLFMRSFFWSILLLLYPLSCQADMQSFFEQYVDNLVKTNTPVFYTSCQSKGGKSVLFFKLGDSESLLVELESDTVVNLGTIQVKQGEVTVKETHGGAYSYQRVSEVTKYMLTLNFTFLMPKTIRDALKKKSKQLCISQ